VVAQYQYPAVLPRVPDEFGLLIGESLHVTDFPQPFDLFFDVAYVGDVMHPVTGGNTICAAVSGGAGIQVYCHCQAPSGERAVGRSRRRRLRDKVEGGFGSNCQQSKSCQLKKSAAVDVHIVHFVP
jgi:hypothetical protein